MCDMSKVFQRRLVLGGIFLASLGAQSSVLGAPIPFSTQKKPVSTEKTIQNYLTKNNVTVDPESGLRKMSIRKTKEAYGKKPERAVKKPAGPQFPQKIVKMKSPVPYKGLTVALEENF